MNQNLYLSTHNQGWRSWFPWCPYMSLQKSTMNWTGEIPPDQPEVNSLAQGHTAQERIKTLSTSETTHSLLINSQLRLYLLQLWLYWNWDFILNIIVTLYLCIYISKLWLYFSDLSLYTSSSDLIQYLAVWPLSQCDYSFYPTMWLYISLLRLYISKL